MQALYLYSLLQRTPYTETYSVLIQPYTLAVWSLYARDRAFSAVGMDTADAPADLQAHFVSALYSTGTTLHTMRHLAFRC